MESSDPEVALRDPLETITYQGNVVCMFVRSAPAPKTTRFYTPCDFPIQVGKIVHLAGSEIVRHSHRAVDRNIAGITEVLLVQRGRVSIDVYAADQTHLCTRELTAGDVILQVAGGHGFRFSEDTVLVEVKQGPYQGDQEKEPF